MSNIAFFSNNDDFKQDLITQVEKYAPELKVCDEEETSPDIAVIDEDGTVYAEVRKLYPDIPLIFLVSGTSEIEENGLNIVLQKPLMLSVFLDVLRSANNKLDSSSDGYINFGSYQLRPIDKEIENTKTGEVIKLTEKEVSIIKYLYKYKDSYINKNNLQENVWKYNVDVSTHTVETHIYRLRRKVEKNGAPQLISTDKGGYKLNMEN